MKLTKSKFITLIYYTLIKLILVEYKIESQIFNL